MASGAASPRANIDTITFHCYDAAMTASSDHHTRDEMDEDQPRYSLSELTDEAGVSVRTVRYYIAEGLLPPPVNAGPRSSYTQAHLDRLRLIDRMKSSYLPLKEIRRRLTAMNDTQIRHLVESDVSTRAASIPAPRAVEESTSRPPDSAASYIARLLHRPPPAAPPAPSPAPRHAARGAQDQRRAEAPAPNEASADTIDTFLAEPLLAEPAQTAAPPPEPDAGSWRRISLGDDAELLIRDETYHRKRERVDWLVGWARKVFG
jgi:DNA-binding transcriptional MerR regulator